MPRLRLNGQQPTSLYLLQGVKKQQGQLNGQRKASGPQAMPAGKRSGAADATESSSTHLGSRKVSHSVGREADTAHIKSMHTAAL